MIILFIVVGLFILIAIWVAWIYYKYVIKPIDEEQDIIDVRQFLN